MIANVAKRHWGHETDLASNDIYSIKQIYVKHGSHTPLKYYEKTVRSFTSISGSSFLEVWDAAGNLYSSSFLQPFRPFYIPNFWMFKLSSPTEDSIIIEMSMAEANDEQLVDN